MKVSLIIPCYNEEKVILFLYDKLKEVADGLPKYEFEFLYVDDGSTDGTLSVIKELATRDNRVLYLSFSRNFGKEAAMYAGFCNVEGDYVAVMDADMQDPPALLPKMLSYLEQGYDSVAARRVSRNGEPRIRSCLSRLFYRVINKISDTNMLDGVRDFRLMKREMVEAVKALGEYNRFSKGIFDWIGFKTYWLPYDNVERVAGESKWNVWGLFNYSLNGIVNFSQAPLTIASWFGLCFTVLSFVMILIIIIRKLIFGDPVAGWASLVCVVIFIGGVQLLCLGIMGQYIAKTYLEVKKRPHYIIAETNCEKVEKVK